ncbi:MAG: ABC transporter permease [Candidatus ainarchaeum sp.]|nr:ABC transporter permease [Candidatus ainarchaeum sp.]
MIEIILQAIKNLRREGLRTFLTLIGIVIGIAAIVSLISVGNGLTNYFEEQFESIGANSVFAAPGDAFDMSGGTAVEITQRDVSNIKAMSNVDSVITEYAMLAITKYDGETTGAMFFSVDDDGYDLFNELDYIEIIEGRMVEKNESTGIMIDERLAKKAFEKEINLRNTIELNGEKYKVVGIFKLSINMGGIMGGGGMAMSSLKGYSRIGNVDKPVEIIIRTNSIDDVDFVAEQVKEYFEKKYGEKSVTVLTLEQTTEMVNEMLSLITLVLAGIAGISLVVGGIGIMNAMITSVLERTKEIGLMKALGASNNKILTLFILESAFIGLIGGIIGIIIGFLLAILIGIIGTEAGMPLKIQFDFGLFVGALAFSMIIGMLSGFYPALKASKMDAVEAMRYE